MSGISKEARLALVHQEALDDFDDVQLVERPERMQALQDRRFIIIQGAQWEDALGEQFANKPRFEVDKVHLAVIRIYNEYRNNRITVDFTPKDGQQDDTADLCDGLYRADERDSTAQEAYDNSFEEGVAGGMGAWRLRARYEDEGDDEDERQRVSIEPIFEADSCVFFDLDAKRRDKSDAKKCWVLTGMTRKAYTAEYNDDPATWPREITQRYFDWCTGDQVYLAEYYVVEEKKELIHVFRGLDDEDMFVPDKDLQDDPDKLSELTATGFREVRQKRITRKRVHKYLMSGSKVLEDCGYIAGTQIPIVPFYGKHAYIDGVERFMGHVRLAKDAQRLANMLRSWLAEIATFSPISKPIFTAEQVRGHETRWANDAVERYPYLTINAMTDATGQAVAAGPVGYTKAPEIPPALAALLQITEQDLQDLLGNQQAGEQMQSNISGKVVELIQTKLDMQAFIYMSNFAVAMKRSGEIWLSMEQDIITEEKRRLKVVTEDGEVSSEEVNAPAYNADTGQQFTKNDMSSLKLDVWSDVGPSSNSQRSATVRTLTGLAQLTTDPATQAILLSTAAMNVEGEGLKDLREYFRKQLIKAGAVKPTKEEEAELAQAQANAQPDPNVAFLQAEAEKSLSMAKKYGADTVQSLTKASLNQAQTEKTLGEVQTDHVDRGLSLVNALQSQIPPGAEGLPPPEAPTPAAPPIA